MINSNARLNGAGGMMYIPPPTPASSSSIANNPVSTQAQPSANSTDNTGLSSIFDVFSNFNYTPAANTSQYGAEPYNTAAQLNTLTNPAAFFTMPTGQAQTAINTIANTNAIQNSNVPVNLPANNPQQATAQTASTTTQSQNPIETVITDIENAINNLIKSIFGK